MSTKLLVVLILIILLGTVLRIYNLTSYPPSLNWDEVSHGYNAYSILETGRDEWGKLLPILNFRAYGDYPLPLNLYLTIPSIAIFGLNEFSIRLPHVILGVLTIVATYFLAHGLTKNSNIALSSAFLIAIEPWTLFGSRHVNQANIAIFFLTLTGALFFNRTKNKWFLPLSVMSLGLTLYSYHSTRIFSPLLLIAAIFIYRKTLVFSKVILVLIILFFGTLPLIFMNPDSRARTKEVFLINEGAVNKIIELRSKSKLPYGSARLIYNRPVYLFFHSVKNYLDYFSPNFLFLDGGTQYQFSVPNHGVLYIVNLPFFYIGLFLLIKHARKDRDYALVLAWLLLSPIAASITTERFAVLRSSAMLPLPQILSSIGFIGIVSSIKNSRLKGFAVFSYITLLLFLLTRYLYIYSGDYAKNYSWSWQYGYKQVVSYVKENYVSYDKIIVTKKYGEPHEFFLFYWQWDPNKYMSDPNLIRHPKSDWFWVDRFDKIWFVNDWQVNDLITEGKIKIDCISVKCLLVTSPENHPAGWIKIKDIDFLDGKRAFEIYEN